MATANKRQSTDMDDQLSDLIHITQQIANSMNGLSSLPIIGETLANAINNLINTLSEKLDKIIDGLSNSNVISNMAPSNNTSAPSYSSVAAINNATTTGTNEGNNTFSITPLIKELADVKNQRNDAFYKVIASQTRAEIYEQGLAIDPPRIPKKLHEKIDYREHDNIRAHKEELSKQNVRNEIIQCRLHESIHRNTLSKLNNRAAAVFDKVVDSDLRERVVARYRAITEGFEHKTIQKWKDKAPFFASEQHTVLLGF